MSASTSASSLSAPPLKRRTPPGPSAWTRYRSAASAAAPARVTQTDFVRAASDPSPSLSSETNRGVKIRSTTSDVCEDGQVRDTPDGVSRPDKKALVFAFASASDIAFVRVASSAEAEKHAIDPPVPALFFAFPRTLRELQLPVGAVSYASAHALRTHEATPSVSEETPARL